MIGRRREDGPAWHLRKRACSHTDLKKAILEHARNQARGIHGGDHFRMPTLRDKIVVQRKKGWNQTGPGSRDMNRVLEAAPVIGGGPLRPPAAWEIEEAL